MKTVLEIIKHLEETKKEHQKAIDWVIDHIKDL